MNEKLKQVLDNAPYMQYRMMEPMHKERYAQTYAGGDLAAFEELIAEYNKETFGNMPQLDALLAEGASGGHQSQHIMKFLRHKIAARDSETHNAAGKLTRFGKQQRKKRLSAECGFAREHAQAKRSAQQSTRS